MDVFDALGSRSGAARVRKRNERILIQRLRFQSLPSMVSGRSIKTKAFQHSLIERSAKLTCYSIRICVDNKRYMTICLLELVEERDKFFVDDDDFGLRMVEDVRNIFWF